MSSPTVHYPLPLSRHCLTLSLSAKHYHRYDYSLISPLSYLLLPLLSTPSLPAMAQQGSQTTPAPASRPSTDSNGALIQSLVGLASGLIASDLPSASISDIRSLTLPATISFGSQSRTLATTTTSATTTSSSDSSAGAAPTASSNPQQNGDGGGSKLPVVLGAVFGVIAAVLLGLLLCLLWRRRRNRRARAAWHDDDADSVSSHGASHGEVKLVPGAGSHGNNTSVIGGRPIHHSEMSMVDDRDSYGRPPTPIRQFPEQYTSKAAPPPPGTSVALDGPVTDSNHAINGVTAAGLGAGAAPLLQSQQQHQRGRSIRPQDISAPTGVYGSGAILHPSGYSPHRRQLAEDAAASHGDYRGDHQAPNPTFNDRRRSSSGSRSQYSFDTASRAQDAHLYDQLSRNSRPPLTSVPPQYNPYAVDERVYDNPFVHPAHRQTEVRQTEVSPPVRSAGRPSTPLDPMSQLAGAPVGQPASRQRRSSAAEARNSIGSTGSNSSRNSPRFSDMPPPPPPLAAQPPRSPCRPRSGQSGGTLHDLTHYPSASEASDFDFGFVKARGRMNKVSATNSSASGDSSRNGAASNGSSDRFFTPYE